MLVPTEEYRLATHNRRTDKSTTSTIANIGASKNESSHPASRPLHTTITNKKRAMFAATARRLAQSGKDSLPKQVPFTVFNNPYQARKVWPPNFKELNHAQQLRFEKKYKRRIFLASRSPRWEKGVKFAQLATIAAALVWLLFYSEFEWWGKQYKPSEEMRRHARNLFGVIDPEKRYERRPDAPEPQLSTQRPESRPK
ncbi:hypothetical protein J3459_006540 [Metarhizium acridum]|uniref:uncharacterized protein n=1 Tax=Metarhizium acridum TaxID=92637 RepID=UPI001C6B4F81|nr:hypothetical protein J3458_005101 [Metarhizium acridum]KAG8427617.1 hypothetical protein J3459_006540 [Metarhizium acridum]